MRRIAAAVFAIGLVLAAIATRAALDDDGDSPQDGGNGRRIVCAEMLRDACLSLGSENDVVIEDPADTADRLTTATDVDFDAWITVTPWPSIVDDARTRGGLEPLFDGATVPLAHTRLAAVGPAEIDGCGWRCIGDRAATDLRVGSRSIASTGLGVLTAAAAAGGWFGSSDFATNDFDPEFDRWIAGFAGAVEPSAGPVRQLLQNRAFFDVAIDLEATAQRALSSASEDRSMGLTLQYPAPVVTIEATIATARDGADVAAELRDALLDGGWSPVSDAPLGLPAPGVLIALRDRIA